MRSFYLHLNYKCNNNCMFCSVGIQLNNVYKEKSTEYFKGILEIERNQHDCVVFTGGEPTLRKDVFELVKYAQDLGYSIIFQTNGRMFSYHGFTKKFAYIDNIDFVVNICAHRPEIHDYITRVDGSFNQTIRGIENLMNLGKNVTADVVINKLNYKHLKDICEYLSEKGITNIKLSFVEPNGLAYINFEKIVPKISEVKVFLEKTLTLENNGINIVTEGFPFCFLDTPKRSIEYLESCDIKHIRVREDKSKVPACKNCVYNSYCEGMWKNYLLKFGDSEFVPFKK